MTTRPFWLGIQGEAGVDAAPALLTLVGVSAGDAPISLSSLLNSELKHS